jgi:hypothetical protein
MGMLDEILGQLEIHSIFSSSPQPRDLRGNTESPNHLILPGLSGEQALILTLPRGCQPPVNSLAYRKDTSFQRFQGF